MQALGGPPSETCHWRSLRATMRSWVWFMVVLWYDQATSRELHQCTGCVVWEIEGAAAISLRAERGAKVAWKKVPQLVVYWLQLDDGSRRWCGGCVRSWKLDEEFGKISRSPASTEAEECRNSLRKACFQEQLGRLIQKKAHRRAHRGVQLRLAPTGASGPAAGSKGDARRARNAQELSREH